jgi:tRNA-specific 2-thiouridylase
VAFPLDIPPALRSALAARPSVLLALSGGVDSGLTLALLRELGCDVGCVTFKNFCYADGDPDDGRACCSLEAIADARRLAVRFGAPHRISGVERAFRTDVIEPFIAEYSAGRTPNPCLACNAQVRFPQLVRLADLGGYDLVATGHYARIDPAASGGNGPGVPALLRGLDREKDQSYFLYRLAPELLRRTVFPLGWFTKRQVRRAAVALGLPVAEKRESQEICFVPDGDRSFLFPEPAAQAPGEIVDRRGRLLGRHRGLVHYTVGQRRGLGVAADRPLYVQALEPAINRLVVGFREELACTGGVCDDAVRLPPDVADRGPEPGEDVSARIRHRHPGTPVRSWRFDGAGLEVTFVDPVFGAAPGQALVLYAGERVIAGGRMIETRTEAAASAEETPPAAGSEEAEREA